MKKVFTFTFLALLAASCRTQQNTKPAAQANYNHTLEIGQKNISVEVANTDATRQQGLSDRKIMADDQGMLFVFQSENAETFWMKDMYFNLDFIWIDKNKVVGITADAPGAFRADGSKIADNQLPLYPSPTLVDQVVEVNAGWAKKNNINIGDDVILH
jgi:uncharacterized membrane protein (UPF0127 family)